MHIFLFLFFHKAHCHFDNIATCAVSVRILRTFLKVFIVKKIKNIFYCIGSITKNVKKKTYTWNLNELFGVLKYFTLVEQQKTRNMLTA
jgi:hypothetical protein